MFFARHSARWEKILLRPTTALLLLVALAFAIRIAPFLLLRIPIGLDSYLHLSVAGELAQTGFNIPLDPVSMLGLKAYSYPPLFHLMLAGLLAIGGGMFSAHLLSSLLGAACVPLIYFTALEVFGRKKERVALLAAFFMATAPSHIFRTAIPMPESLGVFMYCLSFFFVVRFVKTKQLMWGLLTVASVAVYSLAHRGWFLFILTLVVYLIANRSDDLKKRRNLAAFIAIVTGLCFLISRYFSELIQRLQLEPVSALGYFKWVGIIHLALGFWGIVALAGVKDRTQRFVVLMAAILLLMGSISFRFRDPYAALPMSLLAAWVVFEKVLPMLRKVGDRKLLAVGILALCVAQAFYTSVYAVDYPQPGEREALGWLNKNTPENSTILTWKEEGHYIIGLADRTDIVMWKKFYEGFFSENPPTVEESTQAYNDVAVMFRTRNPQRMKDLISQYSVDYIYIDKKMRTEFTAIQYGLVEYLGIDTMFRPLFINDDAEIYQVVKGQQIAPEDSSTIVYNGTITGADITLAEKGWTGMAYIDRETYKANPATNARLAVAYWNACQSTGEQAFCDRSGWLIGWLGFQQLVDGAWTDQDFTMPRKSTQVTCSVTGALLEMREAPGAGELITGAAKYIKSQVMGGWVKTFPGNSQDMYKTDSFCLPVLASLAGYTGDGSFTEAAGSVARGLVKAQAADGSWKYSEETTQEASADSQATVLYGLADYYAKTNNDEVKTAVEKGAQYLSKLQDSKGAFPNYMAGSKEKVARKESYARAVEIYSMLGMEKERHAALGYLARYAGSRPITLSMMTETYFILGLSPAGLKPRSE